MALFETPTLTKELVKITKATAALTPVTCAGFEQPSNAIAQGDLLYIRGMKTGPGSDVINYFDGTTCAEILDPATNGNFWFYKISGKIYLYGDNGSLWKITGTTVTELLGGTYSSLSPHAMPYKDKLYFIATNATFTNHFFKLDTGTDSILPVSAAGAAEIRSKSFEDTNYTCNPKLCIGPSEDTFTTLNGPPGGDLFNTNFGTRVYYTENAGATDTLYVINPGDAAPTVVATDLPVEEGILGGSSWTNPRNIARTGSYLYFSKKDGDVRRLYMHRGDSFLTPAIIANHLLPKSLEEHSGSIYFTSFNNPTGQSLYKATGSSIATVQENFTTVNPYLSRYQSIGYMNLDTEPVIIAPEYKPSYIGYYSAGVYKKIEIPFAWGSVNILGLNDNGSMVLSGLRVPSLAMSSDMDPLKGSQELWVYDGTKFTALGVDVPVDPRKPVQYDGEYFYIASLKSGSESTWRINDGKTSSASPSITAVSTSLGLLLYPFKGLYYGGTATGLYQFTPSSGALTPLNTSIESVKLIRKAGDDLLIVAKDATDPAGPDHLYSYRPSDGTLVKVFASLVHTGEYLNYQNVAREEKEFFLNGTYFIDLPEGDYMGVPQTNVYRYNPSTRSAAPIIAGYTRAWRKTSNAFYATVWENSMGLMKILKFTDSGVSQVGKYGAYIHLDVFNDEVYAVGGEVDLSPFHINPYYLFKANEDGTLTSLASAIAPGEDWVAYYSRPISMMMLNMETYSHLMFTSSGQIIYPSVLDAEAAPQYGTVELMSYDKITGTATKVAGTAPLIGRSLLHNQTLMTFSTQKTFLNLSGDANIWVDSLDAAIGNTEKVKVLTVTGEETLF
ncbi:hypothetical protein QJS83_14700 [Bdellovibrio sp. 22V]|uniref:hypothetical protein n=1 Tax=Bdellovibrio sp. 22V TaxID=3044166 RepID=UPI002543B11B|nr:hypothetical protein [Bdellovibrio sp. 22V]WII71716.1 hypothetical protein QJS83_14700 [Bdellovibrio sp. 22V]